MLQEGIMEEIKLQKFITEINLPLKNLEKYAQDFCIYLKIV